MLKSGKLIMKQLATAMLGGLLAAIAGITVTVAQVDNHKLGNDADGADWPAIGRTFNEDHYSPLDQINDKNVGRLGLVSFTDLPPASNVSTAPLEVDGVIYFAVAYSVVYATDAKTGRVLWTYDPVVPSIAGDKLQAGWGSRGIAFWNGKVYVGTQDGRLLAVDAGTGKLVWSIVTTEPDDGRYISGPPRVFNGKVIIGHGGGDFKPTRGYVTAYDAETGKQIWRFYTVPGDPKKGFEDSAQAVAAKSWSGAWWKLGGGGTVWNAITYDPLFNQIYLGTGNAEPWNYHIRGAGDSLFTASIVALDADTGKYVWHYQVNPGETWDYDATMDIELATLPINGKERPVILHAPKDGFFYVIDRKTGKLLSAEKFVRVNWADRINLKTGRPVENPQARELSSDFVMFPGAGGGHNIQAMSFNPLTRLVYIPAREEGWVYSAEGIDPKKWVWTPGFVLSTGLSGNPPKASPPRTTSTLLAWDPLAQRPVWWVPTPGPTGGGTATTAGNLVFQGQADGKFNAYSADTGKLVWSFFAQVGILAQPISYMIDGKQYVTVVAGYGGPFPSNPVGVFGWDYNTQPRRVLTFALDGKVQLPTAQPTKFELVDEPAFKVDTKLAEHGAAVYTTHCYLCHGAGVVSGGTAPDLRASSAPLSSETFSDVVQKGALVTGGMPRFDGLSSEDIEGLRHYIRAMQRGMTVAAPIAMPR
jgi:quinohemoprotein ethanol dehydrogenase